MEKVTVNLDADWHGNSTETLWVDRWFKENSYQIKNVPFYAKGISFGDVIEVTEVEGIKYFKGIIKKVVIRHIGFFWKKIFQMRYLVNSGNL